MGDNEGKYMEADVELMKSMKEQNEDDEYEKNEWMNRKRKKQIGEFGREGKFDKGKVRSEHNKEWMMKIDE